MRKDVVVKGEKFLIDTTPVLESGYRPLHAVVLAVHESPASGVVANTLRELGIKPKNRVMCEVDDDAELAEVVLAAGWKFSRSKQWKRLWEWARRRA